MEYTKGEWKVWKSPEKMLAARSAPDQQGGIVCTYVVGENDKQIARVEAPNEPELTPNARLIAAAPLLHQAGKDALASLKLWANQHQTDEVLALVIHQLEYALAKAEGK